MKNFKGVFTALITPFKNGKVDFDSLERLVQYQVKNRVTGFVVNGTTAESPTLKEQEVIEIFKFIRSKVGPNFPLIMGTGNNDTETTIKKSKEAEALGADAVLVVVPYYNKPPQRGLLEHYVKVADAVNIPVILYNVPSRTITALELPTIKKLSEHPNIIGIKEASGNIAFLREIKEQCGDEFLALSGDDATYDEFMMNGGHGTISVASHLFPQVFHERKASKYLPLINYLFVEANPIPVKMAMHLMGVIDSPELRLPLVTLADNHKAKLKELLKEAELI